MIISSTLIDEVRRGRVVLFLGAGASKGAKNKNGKELPSGRELRDLLSDRFLGGKSKDEPLSWVAELAISETDLATVWALEANPNEKQLHYQYAMFLREKGDMDISTLIYHFRRSFTRWDSNYEAQFWYARYTFESNDKDVREESKTVFRKLRDTPMAHEVRIEVKDLIREKGVPKLFTGTIVKKEDTNGFVERDGSRDWIFFHRNNQAEEVWPDIKVHGRVEFKIGFSFSGGKAVELKPV